MRAALLVAGEDRVGQDLAEHRAHRLLPEVRVGLVDLEPLALRAPRELAPLEHGRALLLPEHLPAVGLVLLRRELEGGLGLAAEAGRVGADVLAAQVLEEPRHVAGALRAEGAGAGRGHKPGVERVEGRALQLQHELAAHELGGLAEREALVGEQAPGLFLAVHAGDARDEQRLADVELFREEGLVQVLRER